ncbi:MAG: restriction endonuclease subunit S [Prevotella sp.]|nr:restriction endonuclease subunit S [Prevotella sp.]
MYIWRSLLSIIALGRGATFKEVSKAGIEGYSIVLPPFPLQQSFAEKVEAIERQKELIKKSIAEVETLFNSCKDYYFY